MFKLLKNIDYKKIETRIFEIDQSLSELERSKEKKKKHNQLQKSDLDKLNTTLELKKEKLDLLLINLELLNDDSEKVKSELISLESRSQQSMDELNKLNSHFNDKNLIKKELVKNRDSFLSNIDENESKRNELILKIKNIDSSIVDIENNLESCKSDLSVIEKEIDSLTSEYEKKNIHYSSVVKSHTDLRSILDEKKSLINNLTEKLNFEENDLKKLNESFEMLSAEDSSCEKKLQEIKDEILRVEQKKNIIESVVGDYKNELGITKLSNSSISKTLEIKKSELSQKESEKEILEHELEKLKIDQIEMNLEEQNLTKQVSEIQLKMSKIQNSVFDSQRERDLYLERIADLEVEITSIEAELTYKEQELSRVQSDNTFSQRSLDAKQVEFDGLKQEVSRLTKDVDLCLKDSDSKKTSLLKLDASILSLKEQLKVQYDSLTEYSERRKVTSDELEVSQIKYNNLFEEVSTVYREWTEEKINFEDLEKRLSSVNLECTTLNNRLITVTGYRDELSKEMSSTNMKLSESVNSKLILEQEIQKNESDVDYLKVTTEHLNKKISELNIELSDLTRKNQSLESDKKILEFKSSESQKEQNAVLINLNQKKELCDNLEQSIITLSKNLANLDVEVSSKKLELENINSQIVKSESRFDDLQTQFKNQSAENKLLTTKLEQLVGELNEIKQNLNTTEIDFNSAKSKKEILESEIKEFENSKINFQNQIELNSGLIVEINSKIENLNSQNNDLKFQINNLEELNSILEQDKESTQARYNEASVLNSKLSSTLSERQLLINEIGEEKIKLSNMIEELNHQTTQIQIDLKLSLKEKQLKEDELSQVVTNLNTKKSEFDSLNAGLNELTNEVDLISKQIEKKSDEEKNIERLKLDLISSVDELERKKLTYQARLRTVSVRETELANLQRTFSAEKSNLVSEITKLETTLNESDRNVNLLTKKNEIEFKELKDLRIAYSELLSKVQSKKGSFDSNQSSSQTMQLERSKLRKKLAELQAVDRNIDLDFERKKKDSMEMSNEIENLKSKISTLESSISHKHARNEMINSSLNDQSVIKANLLNKRDDLNIISKNELKTKKVSPSNLTESLILKIENYLAKISFNSNLYVKLVTDNDANREMLTMFYTNLNRIMDSFDVVEDITFELGAKSGKISLNGIYKKDLDVIRNEQSKKNFLLMFRSLRESQVGDVIIDANKLTINYNSYSLEKEKGF